MFVTVVLLKETINAVCSSVNLFASFFSYKLSNPALFGCAIGISSSVKFSKDVSCWTQYCTEVYILHFSRVLPFKEWSMQRSNMTLTSSARVGSSYIILKTLLRIVDNLLQKLQFEAIYHCHTIKQYDIFCIHFISTFNLLIVFN